MTPIRWLQKAKTEFAHALGMSDIVQAVQLIGRWVGKPITKTKMVRTGTKTDHSRKTKKFYRGEKWDGMLWLGGLGNLPRIRSVDPLRTPLLDAINDARGAARIGDYIVQHFPGPDEKGLGTIWDQGDTVPAYILVARA